ncbi:MULTISPECIES: thiopeptide-type bacteriocin biosynthesis protein [unclassified Sphingobacterium]|uniref:thiopeptide-type bacteriocin biosynthesis protein n=1 Tax=unclassified Sphingobacterium TaxID=2609468 RepID=UPI0010503EA6|nr:MULTISPECIES: thiopeptide-type bacteriocin biosynthesis protein [unclassified Sphingobacterium]MCS3557567.1 thiopeptide-type bacteriocin biosynthesis protein [Sphingobacterium sp. JUb21]TCQ95788.1 thiopeptide-type bacteriocin biosynthesis protein [Sphingobacterium sp. JUb20]
MNIKRIFIPGSEWLYIKIYLGTSSSDNFLVNDLLPVVHKLLRSKSIDKWFFIRYNDPEPHIRIRFLLKEKSSFANVLNIIYKRINKDVGYLIWQVQLDTYIRELERYNKDLIVENETLFYCNSNCVLSLIKEIMKNSFEEKYRWMISLKLIDSILTSFNQDTAAKLRILENLSASFKKEFNISSKNTTQFKNKYRANKEVIFKVLNNSINEIGFVKMNSIVDNSLLDYNITAKKIMKKISNKNLPVNLDSLMGNHIHMMMNRMFCSDNRTYELVIYDFLFMYYKSIHYKK